MRFSALESTSSHVDKNIHASQTKIEWIIISYIIIIIIIKYREIKRLKNKENMKSNNY